MSEPITGPWKVSEAEYFSDVEHVSASMLKVASRSLVEYHGRFITGTIAAPKPSAEMRLGTCLHAALLEPARWSARCKVQKVDGRTRDGKEYNIMLGAYREQHPDALMVTEEEDATVTDMKDAVMGHDEASRIFNPSTRTEGPIRWRDEASGLPCKAKIDLLTCNGMVGDVKTTSDIAGFPWSAHRYQYHNQAAHYLAGAWSALAADGPMLFVVVSSVQPYEVRTMVFGEEELALGRRQNARLLAELAECHRSGKWESRYQGIETIRYKTYQMQMED